MNEAKTYEIKEISWPAKTFMTRRATRKFEELPDFFGESYGMIYGSLARQGKVSGIPPFAFYYSIDENNKTTDLAAAVEAEGNISPEQGLEKIILPASRLITTTYYGSYENMLPAYTEMERYLSTHRMKKELVIEQYFSDPQTEKDPS